jgi:oleate hydratase
MYYSSGNYDAFVRPEKPAGVDKKSAYLVGAGLASLAAAAFMIRDGQMKGERIHILDHYSKGFEVAVELYREPAAAL